MNLKYTIPTAVLSTTLTACADPIIGEWNATQFIDDGNGETQNLPYEDCYAPYESYDAQTNEPVYGEEVCVEISYKMNISNDLTGMFSATYANEDIPVTVTKEAANQWTITSANNLLSFECTLNDRELECDVTTTSYSIIFEK